MDVHVKRIADLVSRRSFVGGSDARVIMGQDEKALIRLWQEKRGEVGLAQITKTSPVNIRYHWAGKEGP